MAVAREEQAAVPEVPPPPALRPLLRFARLPPRALATVRRVVEDDDGFRARVRAAVEEHDVGRAAWIWLDRPAGWEEELADLAHHADGEQRRAREDREERVARRRLEGAEEAARRAEAAEAAARRELDEARAALAEERRGRHLAESDAGRLRRRLHEGEEDRRVDRRRVEEAERGLQRTDGELRATRDALRALEDEVAALRAERDRLAEQAAAGPASLPGPAVDPAAIALVLEQAAAAVRGLGAALGTAADLLRGAPADVLPGVPAAPPPPPPPGRVAPAPRRQPAPLPPAVFDDSVEAAEHLVRLPGALLLVDGYNVAMAAWPGCPLPHQRDRLVRALSELAARTGCEPRVVFDGSADAGTPVGTGSRAPVQVTFSPPRVEADDVLIDWAGRVPPGRPVVVASSDRRVQEGARRAGANVVGADQLLGLLR